MTDISDRYLKHPVSKSFVHVIKHDKILLHRAYSELFGKTDN